MNFDSGRRWSDVRKQYRDAWLIVLTLGGSVIIGGNLLGIGPWTLALVVSACMSVYGIVIHVDKNYVNIPADTKGDSIYYLGLLFTFGALVAALTTFNWETLNGNVSGTSGAIRNFGIALLTTIVGLAGRVWFTIFRESPGDLTEVIKSQFEDAVSQMKNSLDLARNDLDIMANQFQHSSKRMAMVADNIAVNIETIAESTKIIAGAGAKYTDRIADATESLIDNIEQLRAVCNTTTQSIAALQNHAVNLDRQFNKTQTRFIETEHGLDKLNRTASSTTDRVGATLKTVASTDGTVVALGKTLTWVQKSAEQAKKTVEKTNDAITLLDKNLSGTKESVEQAKEIVVTTDNTAFTLSKILSDVEAVEASTEQTKEIVEDVDSTVAAAREHSEKLFSTLKNAKNQAQEFSDELRRNVKTTTAPKESRRVKIRQKLKRLAKFQRHSRLGD